MARPRQADGSKRDIVVEVLPLAAAGPAATTRARTGIFRHGLARHAARGAAARPRRAGSAATAAAAQHLHLVAHDLGGEALVALLVLPLAGAQAALDIDLRALAQV